MQWLARLPGTKEILGSSPGRGMTDFCTSIFICLYIYLNLFALPEHLRMFLTSIIVTNSELPNFLGKAIGIINSAKHFPNFTVGTLN